MIVEAQEQIEQMVSKKIPLVLIEDYIEAQPLSEEMKAALWLYAYCTISREEARAETRRTLSELAAAAE